MQRKKRVIIDVSARTPRSASNRSQSASRVMSGFSALNASRNSMRLKFSDGGTVEHALDVDVDSFGPTRRSRAARGAQPLTSNEHPSLLSEPHRPSDVGHVEAEFGQPCRASGPLSSDEVKGTRLDPPDCRM